MQRYKKMSKLLGFRARYYYVHHIIDMLKFPKLLICVAAAVTAAAPSAWSFSPREAVDAMRSVDSYKANARFTVSMPQLSDDVVYAFTLAQSRQPADTLLGVDYLVEWHSVAGTPTPIEGFSAYCAGGDHYRYNGNRLQEYHMSADPEAFCPHLSGVKGVHATAQFVDLLPLSIAADIERMLADSAYRVKVYADTLVSGRRVNAIRTVLIHSGLVAQECEYLFDPVSHLPLRIRQENSPGSISEQSVMVDYADVDTTPAEALSEQALIERYPDVFANLRQSNFRIRSLPGTRLPGFALATPTRERYSRGVNDPFRCSTIVAMLNATDAMTASVIEALRAAAGQSPAAVDILWVFSDKDVDAVESVVGLPREGEHILINGRSLMRDCGAADLPAVVICDKNAFVKNVVVGFNQQLTSDVIQMIALQ